MIMFIMAPSRLAPPHFRYPIREQIHCSIFSTFVDKINNILYAQIQRKDEIIQIT